MKNPLKPYKHHDGKWYVRRGKKYFPKIGAFETKEQAQLMCVHRYAWDLASELRECDAFVQQHDPNYNENDPTGYRC